MGVRYVEQAPKIWWVEPWEGIGLLRALFYGTSYIILLAIVSFFTQTHSRCRCVANHRGAISDLALRSPESADTAKSQKTCRPLSDAQRRI